MKSRVAIYLLLLCVCFGQLASADIIITADEARITIAKLDTLDYLRGGEYTDSARISNLLEQVKVQDQRVAARDSLITKLNYGQEKAIEKANLLGRQKAAWRSIAYISTAVAIITSGLLYIKIRSQ